MEGKIPQCTIRLHCSQILKQYFEPKSDVGKCQLFLSFLKSRSFLISRRILGIKTLKNIESSSHKVKYLAKSFTSISKKYHSKDCNITRHVLVESIVSRRTRQCHLVKCTQKIVNLNPKTLKNNLLEDIVLTLKVKWKNYGGLVVGYNVQT